MKIILYICLLPTLLILAASCLPPTTATEETPSVSQTPEMPATPAEGTLISLAAEDTQIKVGESLTVTVVIHRVADLSGAEVHLTYDHNIIAISDAESKTDGMQISHGDFLQPEFVAINTADNATGTVKYAIAQMQHSPVEGSGELCHIHFQGTNPGTARIAIMDTILADSKGQQISADLVNRTLDIEIK
jgi:hypothetical protein